MRLSESARLYLVDYYVLTEAHNEMIAFLDDVVAGVDTELKRELATLSSELLTLENWTNRSSPGYIDAYGKLGPEMAQLGGCPNISYRDIRHAAELTKPPSALVRVQPTAAMAQKLKTAPPDLLAELMSSLRETDPGQPVEPGSRMLWQREVPLASDSTQAAAAITEVMTDKCLKVSEFMVKWRDRVVSRAGD